MGKVKEFLVSPLKRFGFAVFCPIRLTVEPSTLCNLRCPLCYLGKGAVTRPKGLMSLDTFKRIMADLKGAREVWLTNWGEPLLNPDVPEMIRLAKKFGKTVVVSSNFTTVDEEYIERIVSSNLDVLTVSLDGATQETYSKYRVGGELETLKRNIHALIRVKKRRGKPQPMIEAQCLVSRYSEKELTELERLARSMGVDRLRLKALWFMIPEISCASKEEVETLKRFLPTSDPLRWYNVENGKVIWSLSASRVSCDVAWLNTTFLWDGTVVPCCMDYNGDYAFGNIKTDHFGRIWNNPRYKEFRKTLLKRPHEISICRECPETRLRTEGFRYLF